MKRNLLLTILVCFLWAGALSAQAQSWSPTPIDWTWVKGFGSTTPTVDDRLYGITTDSSGYIYITGQFANTINLGSTTLISNGNADVFLAKLKPDGSVVWSRKIGGSANDYGYGIAVNNSGNVYVTGYITGTAYAGDVTADPAKKMVSNGALDIFIAKYDNDGNFQWTKNHGGSLTDVTYALAVDNLGNTYASGVFQGTATFGASTLVSAGSNDALVIKFDDTGSVVWAKQGSGTTFADIAADLTLDANGDILVVGSFASNSLTFGSTTILNARPGQNKNDGYLLKYSSAGSLQWLKRVYGRERDEARAVSADASNNIYITGYFNDTLHFEGTSSVLTSPIFLGRNTIFVAKFNGSGSYTWGRALPASNDNTGRGIKVADTSVYVSADFNLKLPLQPGDTLVSEGGNGDHALLRYSLSGNFLWGKRAGGASDNYTRNTTVDRFGNVFLIGHFTGTNTFGTQSATSLGGIDAFVARYGKPVCPEVQNLLATPNNIGNTSNVVFSWNTISGVNSYTVNYRVVGAPSWSSTNSTTGSKSVSGLTPGATYEWYVVTVCQSSPLYKSSTATGTNFIGVEGCTTPTGTVATPNNAGFTSNVKFKWNLIAGVTAYQVRYRVSPAGTWDTLNTASNVDSLVKTGLTQNVAYEWQVRTNCSSTFSNFSDTLMFTSVTGCQTPTGTFATPNNNNFTSNAVLQWNFIAGVVNYQVRYKLASASNWTSISTTGNVDSLVLSNLTAGQLYKWQVRTRCTNAPIYGDFSDSLTFTTITGCNIPSGTTAIPNNTGYTSNVVFSWNPVSGAVDYTLRYRRVGTITWTTTVAAAPPLTVSNLANASNYEWQMLTNCTYTPVRIYSSFSDTLTFTSTTGCVTPAIGSTTPFADVNGNQAKLKWATISGVQGYQVAYKLVSGGTFTFVSPAPTAFQDSVVINGLTAGFQYHWMVRSICTTSPDTIMSSWSSLTPFTAVSTCATPTNLTTRTYLVGSSSSATLKWNTVSGGTYYNARYRRAGTSTWTNADNLFADSLRISGLLTSTNYEWQVKAVCTGNGGAYSPIFTFTSTAAGVSCTVPTNPGFVHSATYLRLTWTAVPSALSYNVRYRKQGTTTWKNRGSIVNTYLKIGGLLPNTVYEWQVQAKCATNPTVASPYTAIQTVTTNATGGRTGEEITYSEGEDEGTTEEAATFVALSKEVTASIYPNPSTGVINLVINTGDETLADVQIYDLIGKSVYKSEIKGSNTQTIDLSTFGKGIYVVRVLVADKVITNRIVVE